MTTPLPSPDAHASSASWTFVSMTLAGLALTSLLAACGDSDDDNQIVTPPEPTELTRDTGSTVRVYDYGDVTLHAYTNGPDAVGSGTYIIEGPTNLVLVDAHFLAPFARDYRAYADSLGKPIERVIITHEHVDHWLGLGAAFGDVDVYATAGVKEILDATGQATFEQQQIGLGDAAPDTYVGPGNVLPEGNETIDGIDFEYTIFREAEAEEQVVIKLPEFGIMLVGDLIYNDYHLILELAFDSWINVLQGLRAQEEFTLILPGHGAPATPSIFDDNIEYLETAQRLRDEAEGPVAFRASLEAAYPGRSGGDLFMGLILSRLFPNPPNFASIGLEGDDFFPEGVAVDDGTLYVSSLSTGEIRSVNISDGQTQTLVAAGADGIGSSWGLAFDRENDQLLACGNGPFGAAPTSANAVRAYNPATGALLEKWDMPANGACNMMALDEDGNIFVADVGAPRIVRIDRQTDAVTTWVEDNRWNSDSGFFMAGIANDGEGNFYVHDANNAVYRIPVQPDGSAGTPVAQTIQDADGNTISLIGVDGLAFAGQGTLLSTNSNFQTGLGDVVALRIQPGDILVTSNALDDLSIPASIFVDGATVYVTEIQVLALLSQTAPAAPFRVVQFDLL